MLVRGGCGFALVNVLLFFFETEEDGLVVSKEHGTKAEVERGCVGVLFILSCVAGWGCLID